MDIKFEELYWKIPRNWIKIKREEEAKKYIGSRVSFNAIVKEIYGETIASDNIESVPIDAYHVQLNFNKEIFLTTLIQEYNINDKVKIVGKLKALSTSILGLSDDYHFELISIEKMI